MNKTLLFSKYEGYLKIKIIVADLNDFAYLNYFDEFRL